MDISHFQTLPVTCPHCGASFEAEIWLLVDIAERVDLLGRIREGTLHEIRCRNCNQRVGHAEVPLLLYRSDKVPPMLFSPAQQSATQQNYEQATSLLAMLRERLGRAWDDAWFVYWLPEGPSGVPRSQLPAVVDSNWQAILLLQTGQERNHPLQQDARLRDIILPFLQASAWDDLYHLIQTHPELLNDEANTLMEEVVADMQIHGDANSLQALLGHRDLLRRCREVGVEKAFTEAMEQSKIAIRLGDGNLAIPPEFQDDLNHAAKAQSHHQLHGDLSYLDTAIATWERIQNSPAFQQSPERFQLDALNQAAVTFMLRHSATNDVGNINQAIRLWDVAVASISADSPNLVAVLAGLGNGLSESYERTGRIEYLDQAIDTFQKIVKQMPNDSPNFSVHFNDIGRCLRKRYVHKGQLEDLEQAIQAYRAAIAHSASDSSYLAGVLSNLGNSLRDRYRHVGQLEDLDQAIMTHQAAIEHLQNDSPYQPGVLSNLADCLHDRYRQTGNMESLERAIQIYRRAEQHARINSDQLPSILNSLGGSLHARYEHTGQMTDLEQAIAALQEAIQKTPPGSPDLYSGLGNLSNSLLRRYERTGQLEDLEQAIETSRLGIQSTPAESPDLPASLCTLSICLISRYRRKKQLKDLEEATEASRQAVQQTPPDAPELIGRLNELGGCLQSFFKRKGQLEDLKSAIAAFQNALQKTPINSPHRPLFLTNLGNALSDYFEYTGRLEDLEQAIATFQEAVRQVPVGSPYLPGCLGNLGNGLVHRYKRTGKPEDLYRAAATFEEACRKGMLIYPEVALGVGRDWGNWATERADWEEAARAYTYGVQAIERLYRSQLLRASQETWLSETYGLHAHAAYALAKTGQLCDAALALEQGRARGLSETLARDRADLERVQQADQEAYHHYRQATERLRQLERIERGESISGMKDRSNSTPVSPTQQIHQARVELDLAIARIRRIPGYESFLAAPTYHGIAQIALSTVPLVYLVTTQVGSMALLIHSASSTPEVIWQEAFTEANLNELLIKRKDGTTIGGYLPGQFSNLQWLSEALTEALPLLGKQLLAPVVTRLRTLKASGVCLIPMGLLGLLPLHAARYPMEGREISLLDEFDVAYAPSARVLATVRNETRVRQNQQAPWRLIGIGNPLPDLEVGAWAQIELQRIAPGLHQLASILIPQIHKSAAPLPLEERIRVQSIATLYEQTLQRLQVLSCESASTLIRAGGIFSQAVALFTQLSVLPRAIQATLEQLAAHIPPSLTYSRAEVESIAGLLPAQHMVALYEHRATLQAIWEILPQAEIAHFSCHGHFNAVAPLDSAVLLACDTRLTLRDLLNIEPQRLAHLRLVFLSACQTAITDYQRIPDEVVGLPAGFLQVGVPSVAGTLWSVNDQSTALLVTRFYELYLQGDKQTALPPQPPVRALRLAQRWLRDLTNLELLLYLRDHQHLHQPQESEAERLFPMLTAEMLPALRKAIREGRGKGHPYTSPYYWAAFTYYGAM